MLPQSTSAVALGGRSGGPSAEPPNSTRVAFGHRTTARFCARWYFRPLLASSASWRARRRWGERRRRRRLRRRRWLARCSAHCAHQSFPRLLHHPWAGACRMLPTSTSAVALERRSGVPSAKPPNDTLARLFRGPRGAKEASTEQSPTGSSTSARTGVRPSGPSAVDVERHFGGLSATPRNSTRRRAAPAQA